MSLIIKNGLVLLRDENGWKTENRHIVIEGDRIGKILKRRPAEKEGDRVIDASGKLVMPGLINAHTHAYMTLLRNCADDLPFFDWLDTVLRYEEGMTEEDVYWGTLLAAVEMIKSGTTCFVDMTIKSAQAKTGRRSAAAGAALEAGMRAVISRGLAGVADSEESLTKYGQAVAEMELFADEPLVSFIHGPHAPYSCMADYLRKLTRSAKERGIGQTIHLSESRSEVDGCLAGHGMTPIAYVDSLGVFDVPVIAAHCVYATDDDIRIMARRKVSVALNPKSNCKLGNGFAPADKFFEAGINVCLGTDGTASNNSLNMFAEMNAASIVYKGAALRPDALPAGTVLDMATVNGAKAIGREGELGLIREGALADVILLDLGLPQFVPANDVVSGLVYSSNGSEVDTVVINGSVVMEGRRLLTVDEAKVLSECEKRARRIRKTVSV